MLAELERHSHARAVLAPALNGGGDASHAYLFHGPGGAGKRAVARAVASELLSAGAPDPESARLRVASGAHPDLTWVSPSGAHEILVSDIDEPVISAASKTPFEAARRVFVIERVDELGDEAANRMLKTLEEPAAFVHLILITDRVADVLATIRSRCQLVRFDAPPAEAIAAELADLGADAEAAAACARLGLGDGERARELVGSTGSDLRAAAEAFARAPIAGETARLRPWMAMLQAVKGRGESLCAELEGQASAELELHARKERKRIEGEWNDRIRRARRRAERESLDLALQLVSLWYADLLAVRWEAEDLVRHRDRLAELREDGAPAPAQLQRAIEHVEDTRGRFVLNVNEELACEALSYRLERDLKP